MAWYGSGTGFSDYGLRVAAIYWGLFGLAFLVTLYMVLLDFRYIRMEYKIEERSLFSDTLGNPELREEIRKAREEMEMANNNNDRS